MHVKEQNDKPALAPFDCHTAHMQIANSDKFTFENNLGIRLSLTNRLVEGNDLFAFSVFKIPSNSSPTDVA